MTENYSDCSANYNVYLQRQKMQLLNIPPTRFTPISPYPANTRFQLDMRRKAEILQYSAAKTNTKTNNFTKSEKWAQLISGNFQRRTYSQQDITNTTNNVLDCSSNETILTPTSSSGVPGPIMYLYNDPTVPLYNYVINRSYSILDDNNTQPWNINPLNDISCENGDQTLVSLLGIRKYIQNDYTTFNLTTSVGIYVVGTVDIVNSSPITLSVSNIGCAICYNDVVAATPTVSSGLNTLTVDLNTSKTGAFSASLFVGNITTDDFTLYTKPNMVYDIKLTFTLSSPSDSDEFYFTYTKKGAYCNLSSSNYELATNCSIIDTSNNSDISMVTPSGFNLTSK
jgi:hypothetical protein